MRKLFNKPKTLEEKTKYEFESAKIKGERVPAEFWRKLAKKASIPLIAIVATVGFSMPIIEKYSDYKAYENYAETHVERFEDYEEYRIYQEMVEQEDFQDYIYPQSYWERELNNLNNDDIAEKDIGNKGALKKYLKNKIEECEKGEKEVIEPSNENSFIYWLDELIEHSEVREYISSKICNENNKEQVCYDAIKYVENIMNKYCEQKNVKLYVDRVEDKKESKGEVPLIGREVKKEHEEIFEGKGVQLSVDNFSKIDYISAEVLISTVNSLNSVYINSNNEITFDNNFINNLESLHRLEKTHLLYYQYYPEYLQWHEEEQPRPVVDNSKYEELDR